MPSLNGHLLFMMSHLMLSHQLTLNALILKSQARPFLKNHNLHLFSLDGINLFFFFSYFVYWKWSSLIEFRLILISFDSIMSQIYISRRITKTVPC
jgi:hypothetical protein